MKNMSDGQKEIHKQSGVEYEKGIKGGFGGNFDDFGENALGAFHTGMET